MRPRKPKEPIPWYSGKEFIALVEAAFEWRAVRLHKKGPMAPIRYCEGDGCRWCKEGHELQTRHWAWAKDKRGKVVQLEVPRNMLCLLPGWPK
jgi:hypothetical protein